MTETTLLQPGPTRSTLPLWVEGVVQHGDKRGRLLGFPTANLKGPMVENLALGVYASETIVPGRSLGYRSISSYGTRPTFAGWEPRLETFILDFEGNLYGQTIAIRLLKFIRPERRFDSVDDLVATIQQDLTVVRTMSLD